MAVDLGPLRRRTKRRRLRSRHASSNSALNSDPPSTWMPSMRKRASARSLSREGARTERGGAAGDEGEGPLRHRVVGREVLGCPAAVDEEGVDPDEFRLAWSASCPWAGAWAWRWPMMRRLFLISAAPAERDPSPQGDRPRRAAAACREDQFSPPRSTPVSASYADPSLARKDPKAKRGSSRVLQDHVGAFLGDHDDRGVGVARDHARHDGAVDDAQALDATHFQPRVDHGAAIDAHAAR